MTLSSREEVSHGQAGHRDAQGDAGGHRARDPVRPVRVRLRDHGLAARPGLLRHRRGHRLRAAHQDRAARPRRRGEGPLREGAAAQGLLPQRPGTGLPRRVLEDLELPRRTARTAPRRRASMAMSRLITKLLGDKKQYKQRVQGRALEALPRAVPARRRTRSSGTSCTTAASPTGDTDRVRCSSTSPTSASRRGVDGTPVRDDRRQTTRSSSPRPSPRRYGGRRWIDKERDRLATRDRPPRRTGTRSSHDHGHARSASTVWRSRTGDLQRAARRGLRRGAAAASSPCSAPTAPARPPS